MKKREERSKAHRKGRQQGARNPHKTHLKKSVWRQLVQRYTAL